MSKGEAYEDFVEKFKKYNEKTSDDCLTPPEVYEVVLRWAKKNLPIEGREVVRPFYPGGDYQAYDYPENCVVIDIPPFSIFSRICDWYNERGIPYFLFAPALVSIRSGFSFVAVGVSVIYDNGAVVQTSFVTNMMGSTIAITAPDLRSEIYEVVQQKKRRKQLTRRKYPDNVLRASHLFTMALNGVLFSVSAEEGAVCSRVLRGRKSTYGKSIVLSDAKTQEKIAALEISRYRDIDYIQEELSEEAKEIIQRLNKKS